MKRVFIVNPKAGNGKSLKIIDQLKKICEDENLKYEIIYTKETGHAKRIAEQKSHKIGETIIYSVGGDGTLNEVVNGVIYSNAILGVAPGGTGNDFYKSIKQNGRMVDKVDVGLVNNRYFINVASVGIDARVAAKANELKDTIIPNKLIYYSSLVSEVKNLKSETIKIDDKVKDILLLTVCNGKYYGGGLEIAPNAQTNDGLFDVYEIDFTTRIEVLKLFKLLLQSNHHKSDKVNYYKTDYLKLSSTKKIICNLDGEIITDNKFEFTSLENSVNLLYNDHPKIKKLFLKYK